MKMTVFSDTPAEIAADARDSAKMGEMKYAHYLDDEAMAVLETLSVEEKAYLWAYLDEMVPREVGKALLDEMEKRIMDDDGKRWRGIAGRKTEFVAKPFEHAEKSISAHSVFGKSLVQRQFGAR